ncbi:hypothetical protein BESB_052830 [Besnoitia besnoiti]|uniref:Uncharacterized protein n=1 Tax=Besnoitia besnoiti TaxID=94643 RepID=A0A2A9MJR7_BESBE|nr:hypothetical protein BESB_052830 [Besnoitia besnoiti]PFH35632.1 hypothetical protein BESB_052830 [Besnoitia besnoiti]
MTSPDAEVEETAEVDEVAGAVAKELGKGEVLPPLTAAQVSVFAKYGKKVLGGATATALAAGIAAYILSGNVQDIAGLVETQYDNMTGGLNEISMAEFGPDILPTSNRGDMM